MHQRPQKEQRSLWLWFSGIAVGLLLLFGLNNPFHLISITPSKPAQQHTVSQKEANSSQITTSSLKKEITPTTAETTIAQSTTETSPKLETSKSQNSEFPPSKVNTRIFSSEQKKLSLTGDTQEQNTQDLITPQNVVKKQKKDPKWSVATIAAPVYIGSFNNGPSTLNSNNNSQALISKSFGVQVAYKLSKKLSIQSGVHMVDFAYLTKNVSLLQASTYTNISMPSHGLMSSRYPAMSNALNGSMTENSLNANTTGDFKQVFGYIEIPVEAKYQLTNQNDFGLNVIGGFSTLLLNKNEIFVETNTFSDKLGEASNLNRLNFSGNVGLEFEYTIYKNVDFNLIPMFKVQTQTLNNTNSYKPYTVGLYSGLNLRF